jgi:hypothetical protein
VEAGSGDRIAIAGMPGSGATFFGLDPCSLRTAVVAGSTAIFAGDLSIILARNLFGFAFRATALALIGTELVIAGVVVGVVVYVYDGQTGGSVSKFVDRIIGEC